METGRNEVPTITDGVKIGLTIALGYIPVAIAFGILARVAGISLLDTFLFSAMVFAGASQFMALNLLQASIAPGQIILATFLLNFRHFLMSASLGARLGTIRRMWLPLVAFGVTDEGFSVIATRKGDLTVPFVLSLELVSYIGWVLGSVLGHIAGNILPEVVQSSMGIALYALFMSILVPSIQTSRKALALAIGAALANAIFTHLKLLPPGWTLIAAVIISAAFGSMISSDEEGD